MEISHYNNPGVHYDHLYTNKIWYWVSTENKRYHFSLYQQLDNQKTNVE